MRPIIFTTLVLFHLSCLPVRATESACRLPSTIETKMFKLTIEPGNKMAHLESGGQCTDIYFPQVWLKASFKKKDMEKYVSLNKFDQQVTAFKITSNIIGFHLSSYEVQKSGSSQTAVGQDIFLVHIISNQTTFKGIDNLGATKRRQRLPGCFSATHSGFLLSDMDNDGNIDIGIMKEELICKRLKNTEADVMEGPYYKQHPIRWYIFDKNGWVYYSMFDRRFPAMSYWELPLIGIMKSPIDYVMGLSREPVMDSD